MEQQFFPTGPCPADLFVLGEAPGEREVVAKAPFVGPSGFELDKQLGEVGLGRGAAFISNVCRVRPPKNQIERDKDNPGGFIDFRKTRPGPEWVQQGSVWLHPTLIAGIELTLAEIDRVRPTMVLALGNTALFALTGKWGIRNWRGSVLQVERPWGKLKLIPTYHPAAVLRQMELRRTVLIDLRRMVKEMKEGRDVIRPDYRFIIRPDFNQAWETLNTLLYKCDLGKTKIAADLETRAGHIACCGLAWSKLDAICIPFMCVERLEGYWTPEQEAQIVHLLIKLLTHPNMEIVGQNFQYDAQYTYRWWHVIPRLVRDTMIAQHSMFSVSQKGLDYLASIYAERYEYWKEEGKEWDPSVPEDEYWAYNCKDACYTYEVDDGQQAAIQTLSRSWTKLPEVHDFQQRMFAPVLRTMVRGIKRDESRRMAYAERLLNAATERQAYINSAIGREVNIRSSPQLQDLFYRELGQQEIRKRAIAGSGKPGSLTTDDEALEKLGNREPILLPITTRIQELRSLGVFQSTFVQMRADADGRIRCQYMVGGTDTYRFASRENAFGSGGNLQNIPSGEEGDDGLPNIRELYIPDEGYTFFDIDLDSADLRVVTGESGCRTMQEYFAAKAKPYVEIAREYYRDPTITKHHHSYKRMKALCHGTNYLGTPQGLASRIGLLVHEVEKVQKWYYGKCPEIKLWQEDIVKQVDSRRWIENVFGYRYYIFGRIEHNTYNQAVAWKPQSTVGCLINRIYMNIHTNLPEVEVLLQVHDSLAGQYPTRLGQAGIDAIVAQAQIPLPYTTGAFIIPVGVKTSTKSWGDCE